MRKSISHSVLLPVFSPQYHVVCTCRTMIHYMYFLNLTSYDGKTLHYVNYFPIKIDHENNIKRIFRKDLSDHEHSDYLYDRLTTYRTVFKTRGAVETTAHVTTFEEYYITLKKIIYHD